MATAVLSTIKYTFGYGANSTAAKIVADVDKRIQESGAVQTICSDKGWLTATKTLSLSVEFGGRPLGQMIAKLLEEKTHYVAYQESEEEKKLAFRTAIATDLATALLETVKKGDAVGSERPAGYFSSKPEITAAITFTPLQEDVVDGVICKSADAAGFLKK